jgi:hypothetical protein
MTVISLLFQNYGNPVFSGKALVNIELVIKVNIGLLRTIKREVMHPPPPTVRYPLRLTAYRDVRGEGCHRDY